MCIVFVFQTFCELACSSIMEASHIRAWDWHGRTYGDTEGRQALLLLLCICLQVPVKLLLLIRGRESCFIRAQPVKNVTNHIFCSCGRTYPQATGQLRTCEASSGIYTRSTTRTLTGCLALQDWTPMLRGASRCSGLLIRHLAGRTAALTQSQILPASLAPLAVLGNAIFVDGALAISAPPTPFHSFPTHSIHTSVSFLALASLPHHCHSFSVMTGEDAFCCKGSLASGHTWLMSSSQHVVLLISNPLHCT